MSHSSCAAVILAAGASRRLGQAKQLVTIGGEPLLRRTVRLAAQAGCHPIVVVLGFEADRMRSALAGFRVIVAVNEDWRAGMGSSLRCGVETALQISPPPEAILLMVCDQIRLRAGSPILFYPAGALAITVLAFMIMGDVLRDALDPSSRAWRL